MELPWSSEAQSRRDEEIAASKLHFQTQERRDQLQTEIQAMRGTKRPTPAWAWWLVLIAPIVLMAIGFLWLARS
jgi:hypothetical protein